MTVTSEMADTWNNTVIFITCFTRLNEANQSIEAHKADVLRAHTAEQQANQKCLEIMAKQAHLEEK